MDPMPSSELLAIPDDVALAMRPDCGTVIGSDHEGFRLGDRVLAQRYSGKRIDGFYDGDWQAPSEVALFGITGGAMITKPDLGNSDVAPMRYDAAEALMATFHGEQITPSRGNVLIELETTDKSIGGILMTENYRETNPVVTVKGVHPTCQDIEVGGRYIVHEGAIHPIRLDGDSLALIPEWAFYTRVN